MSELEQLRAEVARLTQQFAFAQDVVAALTDKMPSLIERAGVAEARADRLTTAAQAARDALKKSQTQNIWKRDWAVSEAIASLASVLDGGEG